MLMTVKQRLFQQSRGHNLRLMIQSSQFSNSFEISSMPTLTASFSRFDKNWTSYADDKVKHRLFQQSRTKSNRGFFSNQGDVALIWYGQVSYSSEIWSMSTLSASVRKIWSKLKVMLMTISNRDFFSNQRDVTLRLMIWSGQVSN